MKKLSNIIKLTQNQINQKKIEILGLLKHDELVDATERAVRDMEAQLKQTKKGLRHLSIEHLKNDGELIAIIARDAPFTGQTQYCIFIKIKSIGEAIIKFQIWEISKGKPRISIVSSHLSK